ncbi:MAG TPA: NAD(P)-binding domain-containing protein [Geminicoccaceae bacterium]|nr:NAD(P)-binding domain-containing protein [Geminicoccaceae bacterium]
MRVAVIGRAAGLAAAASGVGIEVVTLRGAAPPAAGAAEVVDYAGFREALEDPRVFFLDLAPGPDIDSVVDTAYLHMDPGDVVVDTSGSYWGDTLRRWRRMRHRAIYYLDATILPQAPGRRILLAGEARGCARARPALERLAAGGPLIRAGAPGAAHYALMVEQALEAMIARARSEARQLLEAFPGPLDALAVLRALPGGEVADAPRAAWLLEDALRLQATTPLLALTVMQGTADALDEQRAPERLPRLGPFVHPDELH